jgi:ABC-2 type transport system permease protein
MIPVILWELRQRRTPIIWWCIASAVMTAVILMLYPSIRDQANQLNQVINQLPQGLRGLKTGGSGNVNVADPIEFLNSQLFYATLPIMWIILAITRGGAALGKDEQSRTLELLLARPISRASLLLSKGLSLAFELLLVGVVTALTLVALTPIFDLQVSISHLLIATLYTVTFSLSFGLVAFTLQAASGITRRFATAAAVLLGFGGYILASLSGLTDWLSTPAKFAPYHYFNPSAVMHGEPVNGLNLYLLGVLFLTVSVSYLGFRRRDIS